MANTTQGGEADKRKAEEEKKRQEAEAEKKRQEAEERKRQGGDKDDTVQGNDTRRTRAGTEADRDEKSELHRRRNISDEELRKQREEEAQERREKTTPSPVLAARFAPGEEDPTLKAVRTRMREHLITALASGAASREDILKVVNEVLDEAEDTAKAGTEKQRPPHTPPEEVEEQDQGVYDERIHRQRIAAGEEPEYSQARRGRRDSNEGMGGRRNA